MNLTSKRVIQFVTVCAGFCALTAAAGLGGGADPSTWWVQDSFEAPEGTNQQDIAAYKQTISGTLNENTNVLWVIQGADESKIVSDETSAGFVGQRPMDAAKNLVLELATEGNTLTRHVIGDGSVTGQSFNLSSVYVDTLIKFTPSEDTPTISNDVKVAVYVNVNSNLVVYHSAEVDEVMVVTNSVFNTLISPTNWYRLTIQLDVVEAAPVCKIYLNGEALTHLNAIAGGDMFFTAAAGTTLSAVAFQGTGWVDELSVANGAYSPVSAAILLTLSYDDTFGVVKTNGVVVASGGTVPTDTLITIDAADWYNVTNVLGVTYAGELNMNLATGIVSSATAATAAITFGPYSTGSFPMGEGTPDAGKVAAWAIANSVSESQVAANAAGWYDEYLLDLAPDAAVTNTIAITSIAVGATDATVKVVASSTAVDFGSINGTLNIYAATNLVTGFGATPVASNLLTFTPANNTNTVVVPIASGSFIKAKVE